MKPVPHRFNFVRVQSAGVIALAAVVFALIANTAQAYVNQRDQRILELRAAISDKQKVIDGYQAQIDKGKPVVSKDQAAYDAAQKDVKSLQDELTEARKQIGPTGNALRDVTKQLEQAVANEPQVQQAQQAADAARTEHQKLRDQKMDEVEKMPDYASMKSKLAEKQSKMKLLGGAAPGVVDPKDIQALQLDITTLQTQMTTFVEQQMQADAQVAAAKSKADEADHNLSQVRSQYTQQIANDPKRKAAEKAAADARVKVADLSRQLSAAHRKLAAAKSQYARTAGLMDQLDQKMKFQQKLQDDLREQLKLAMQRR